MSVAMQSVRSALFVAFMAVTVVVYAVLCLLWAPLPLHRRYALTIGWPRMVIGAARWLCGVRWQIKGQENLPDGPAIILSKHQSTWETFFYPAFLPREVCYVFKRELLYVPFFGWGLALLDMIHIDRRRGRDAFESLVAQGVRKLAQGRWIVIFPEGTRTRVGSQGKYKTGGPRLAVRTNTPVVPIAVTSGECWPKKQFIKRAGMITVSIGKPISPVGKTTEQLNDEVEHWIETEMRRISPHAYNDETVRNEAYS